MSVPAGKLPPDEAVPIPVLRDELDPDELHAVAPDETRPPELDGRQLEAVATLIEKRLQQQLGATMKIVQIKLMQEVRSQLLGLCKKYGSMRRHRK